MSDQIGWRNPLVLCFIFLFVFYSHAYNQDQISNSQAHPQSDDLFTFRVDVDLVTTDIAIVGNAVPEFKKDDFIVYDNKVAQNLSYFSQDQLPIAVALLADISPSIAGHEYELKISALAALRRLKPKDQVALYSFGRAPQRLSDLTEDRLSIAKLLSSDIKSCGCGGTNIYGALYDATRYLKKAAPRRRRAIILISDNCHNITFGHDADSIRTELLESSTTLYSIVIGSSESPSLNEYDPFTKINVCKESDSTLRRIVRETGGEIFEVQGKMSGKAALENAISRLRMQYTLGFNPSDHQRDKQFHSIIVRFADENRCPNCQIIGRRGYYAGVAAPLPLPDKTSGKPRSSSNDADQLIIQRSIIIAGTTFPDLSEIPFKLSTTVQTDANRMQLHIDLVIDSDGLSFTDIGNQRSYKALAAIIRADSTGKIIDTSIRTIAGQLSNESYQRIKETGIPFSATIPLTVPSQNVRVVLYDENSDRIASRLVRIINYNVHQMATTTIEP